MLTFVSAEADPTDIYAEFLQSRLTSDLIFYSSANITQELAQFLSPTATLEANWSENLGVRLQEALKNPAVHVVSQREFDLVLEEMIRRRAEGEIVVEWTGKDPIVTHWKEWQWFYRNWQADSDSNTGALLPKEEEEAKASPHVIEEEGKTRTSPCTMRELPPSSDQYRLYVLNMSPTPLPDVFLCYYGEETYIPLLPACTLSPGPSILCYPLRPQGQVHLSLWAEGKRLCGLWV